MTNKKMRRQLVVMGDVNLDYVVRENLPFRFIDLAENGILHLQEIDERPGGSALNLCYYAKDEFQTYLLGKVGKDSAGDFITEWLNEKKIKHQPNWFTSKPTGKAIICRDASDIRLLVNNVENANHMLSIEDIDANIEIIRNTDVLYISGYCLNAQDAPRFLATQRAIKLAKSEFAAHKPFIVFDVVPHRIYENFSFQKFLELTNDIDLIISEVPTIRRFLALGTKNETIDKNKALETLELTKKYFSNIILRFGPSGCDQQLGINSQTNKYFYHDDTGHNDADDKRGFGDRLTINTLKNFFL
jgi:sugar/nucleoside kinase (ribokinase family)